MKLKRIIEATDTGLSNNGQRVEMALRHLRAAKRNLYQYINDKPSADEEVEDFLDEGQNTELDHREAIEVISVLDDLILSLNVQNDDVAFSSDEIEKQSVYVRK
jgi:hypothetical protein